MRGRESGTACRRWAARIGFCVGLAACLCARAQGAISPLVPEMGKVLVLPKGKPVQVRDIGMQDGTPAREGTVVTVSWDDGGVDMVFDCTDSAIAAGFGKDRDSAKTWKDDSVGVYLDAGHTHDGDSGLIALKLSVAGGLLDRRGEDDSYNVEGIVSEAGRTDHGWRGRIHAPWKGLGVHPKPGDAWGLNLTRIDHEGKAYANMKYLAWAPFTYNFEEVDHWGHVIFAEADAGPDDKAVAAARELLDKRHAEMCQARVFPQEGFVLVLPKGQPGQAAGMSKLKSLVPATQATVMTLSWDDDGLEAVFDCTDDAIAAEHKERDDIKMWKDDCVSVWLDPGHTHNTAGRFILLQLSASGALHDATNGDPKLNVEGAQTEVVRTEGGWRGRIRAPWKGLGAQPKVGDVWGINLTRVDQPGRYDYTKTEYLSWAPLPRDFPEIDRWGHAIFAAAGFDPDEKAVAAARKTLEVTHQARRRALLGEPDK